MAYSACRPVPNCCAQPCHMPSQPCCWSEAYTGASPVRFGRFFKQVLPRLKSNSYKKSCSNDVLNAQKFTNRQIVALYLFISCLLQSTYMFSDRQCAITGIRADIAALFTELCPIHISFISSKSMSCPQCPFHKLSKYILTDRNPNRSRTFLEVEKISDSNL